MPTVVNSSVITSVFQETKEKGRPKVYNDFKSKKACVSYCKKEIEYKPFTTEMLLT